MPRAFLITHRRYNGPEQFPETLQDYSPERGVRLAEYGGGQPTSDGVSDCGSETSSECPEELYNLTKLAEVSLAAAAGTLIHPDNLLYQRSLSPSQTNERYRLSHAASSKHQYHQQSQPQHHHHHHHQHLHQYHNHEQIRLEHHTYHRHGFQRQLHQHSHHASCHQQQQQQQQPQQQQDEHQYETLRKPATIEDVTLRERSRLFFESIEREREILEGVPRDSEKDLSSSEKEIRRGCRSATAPSEKSSAAVPAASATVADSVQAESGKACAEENEEHECPDCGKKYSTSSNLARHRQTHRSLGDKKARRCPHCDKVYVSMPAYSMHVRTHNQGCKCHYCGKCFSRPWLLQGHIRTHTGEKPFKCTICNKAFADKSNLRAHIQTHSNTKPHVCTRCGKAFALKSYLYKHEESSCMRTHHRTPTEKREASSESLAFAPSASLASTAATAATPSTTTMTPSTVTRSSSSTSPALGAPRIHPETNEREREGPSVIVPRRSLADQFGDFRRTAEASGKTSRPSAFSAIIKHTKLSQHQHQQRHLQQQLQEEEEEDVQERQATLPKRRCREPNGRDSACLNKTSEISRTKAMSKMIPKEPPELDSQLESSKSKSKVEASDSDEQSEYVSRMVIRTSVISPNPEHLGRLNSLGKNPTAFDLIEPSRTSGINLNLTIG